jgi:rubrerythrin
MSADAGHESAPRTLDELMVLAWQMEVEAAERYNELADAMETHNNVDVAALFRRLAKIEDIHARKISADMKWKSPPVVPPQPVLWKGVEAPETTPIDEVHYLMQPYQALELALAAERRAVAFFERLEGAATDPAVRAAAREMVEDEREHVTLVEAWLRKVPKPDAGWAEDPDAPRYTD